MYYDAEKEGSKDVSDQPVLFSPVNSYSSCLLYRTWVVTFTRRGKLGFVFN